MVKALGTMGRREQVGAGRPNNDSESPVLGVGLGVCGLFAVPMAWGWGPGLVAICLAVALWRARAVTGSGISWGVLFRHRGVWVQRSALALTVLVGGIVTTVAGRALGGIVIAYPGALFAVAAGALALWLGGARGSVRWGLAAAIPLLAVVGARFESRGIDAQGWAHSGPIHGTIPFQTTAIAVDGYGPFDLPINDFVEPDGHRGYGPEALAVALEQALHRIAQEHFAQGPARAYMAFSGARAGAVTTAGVQERLDRPAPSGEIPRFWVRSGTYGQGSRVEFLCPGRTIDPRGEPPDNVMVDMCPTGYASEASAGLGVTGRWPGYAEFRGNERLGWSRWLGWTRSDDDAGRTVVAWELWLWLVCTLVFAAWIVLRQGSTGGSGMARPLMGWLCLAGVVAATRHSDWSSIPWVAPGPAVAGAIGWEPWLGLLAWPALGALQAWFPRDGIRSGRSSLGSWLLGAVLLWASTDLGSGPWLTTDVAGAPATPQIGTGAVAVPMEAWVAHLAEAIGPMPGLNILELQTVVAGLIGALLLHGCVFTLACGYHAANAVGWRPGMGVAGVFLLAAALGISRLTMGGTALLPVAAGSALVLGSTLGRVAARGPWPQRAISPWARGVHGLWLVVGAALIVTSMPAAHLWVTQVYWMVALAVVLSAVVLWTRDPSPA